MVLSTPFLLQHEKVFFKYLNYVLKLNVFVFIFSRETFLSIFFFAVVFFSLNVLKALKGFSFGVKSFARCSLEDFRCGESVKCRWTGERTKWTDGLVIVSRKWCRWLFFDKIFFWSFLRVFQKFSLTTVRWKIRSDLHFDLQVNFLRETCLKSSHSTISQHFPVKEKRRKVCHTNLRQS